MKEEYNFTEEDAFAYQLTGCLPTRIIPIIGKKLADEVDRQTMEELMPCRRNL